MANYLDKRLSRLRAEAYLNPFTAAATQTASKVGRLSQESMLGNMPQLNAMPDAARQAFLMQQQAGTQQQLADIYTTAAANDIQRRDEILQEAEQVQAELEEQKRQEKLQKRARTRGLISAGTSIAGAAIGAVAGGPMGAVIGGQLGSAVGGIAGGMGVGTSGEIDLPTFQAGVQDAVNVGIRLAGTASSKELIANAQKIFDLDPVNMNKGLLILQQVQSGAMQPQVGNAALLELIKNSTQSTTLQGSQKPYDYLNPSPKFNLNNNQQTGIEPDMNSFLKRYLEQSWGTRQ